MQRELETARLRLRRFTAGDADILVELDSDPEVMRHLSGGVPTPRETIEGEILPAFLRYAERTDGFGFWAAHERAGDAFIGWFHLRPLPGAPPGEVELGYRLRRTAWGRGYGTEGARALVSLGFSELGVRRVVASTAAANTASRRVMEKAGLTLVRTYRPDFSQLLDPETARLAAADFFEGDDVEYALERDDWERQTGGAGGDHGP